MKAVTFPLPPPRVPDDPLGGGGLCRRRPACPGRPALYAVRVPRCRGSASGLLSTPPRDDAVAIGSELAPPLPPEDFHLLATARDGLDHLPPPAGGGRTTLTLTVWRTILVEERHLEFGLGVDQA